MHIVQNIKRKIFLYLFAPPWLVALLCAGGCHEDDDHDHDPPPGQGSMIIENNTFNDISVFVNGAEQNETPEDRTRAYDLNPGVYRVVRNNREAI